MRGQVLGNGLGAARLVPVTHEVGLEPALHEECGVRVQQCTEHREIRAQPLDELAPADDRAAHDVTRARGVLGEAVHEQVDLVFTVLVKAGEGVVHDRERAVAMREFDQPLDVGHLGDGIRGALEDHQRASGRVASTFSIPAMSSMDSMVCSTPNRASSRRMMLRVGP